MEGIVGDGGLETAVNKKNYIALFCRDFSDSEI